MESATRANPQREQTQEEEYLEYELEEHEIWWRDHQRWLEEKGYMLRPRYRPDWIPSWKAKGTVPYSCEDAISTPRGHLMDATRIADGSMVMLKRVSDITHPHELEINRFLTSEPLASHPRNHCVPLQEILDVPGENELHILVMPFLRKFNNPSFKTVGEAVDCFDQVLEGLQFMHQCNIAHRDCMDLNMMMDPIPLYPKMYHPRKTLMTMDLSGAAKHYTRTLRPTRYYLIDFGLSDRYDPARGPPLALPVWGGDKTVPEFKRDYDARVDPFAVDIYYVGNMIQECFLQTYHGVEFMTPLVQDMIHDDPSKRPTIDEVVKRFGEIKRKLSWWKLRSQLVEQGKGGFLQTTGHVFRTIGYIVGFRSAIPSH